MRYVLYTRVSTNEQGKSGLGLAGQLDAINRYIANDKAAQVMGEFRDVMSGKSSARPGLNQAVELCKSTGATLVLAKLDRLSRDIGDLSRLRNEVNILDVESPDSSTLLFAVKAGMAQEEREKISERTRAGLRAKIARDGKYVNNPEGVGLEKAVENSTKARKIMAESNENTRRAIFAMEYMKKLGELSGEDLSWTDIANKLNEFGFRSPSGVVFNRNTAYNLYKRRESFDFFNNI